MVEKNPNLFIKCTLRIDTSGRQWKYYGQLPSRDSPDIQILGRVRGAYEDDIIVLKLDEITLVNKERKEKKIITSGQMQGKPFYIHVLITYNLKEKRVAMINYVLREIQSRLEKK